MAQTHDINPELQRLTGEYQEGSLNTAEYRNQRRVILEHLEKLRSPTHSNSVNAPPRQVGKVQKAKYIGVTLLVISVIALLLFGFKMH